MVAQLTSIELQDDSRVWLMTCDPVEQDGQRRLICAIAGAYAYEDDDCTKQIEYFRDRGIPVAEGRDPAGGDRTFTIPFNNFEVTLSHLFDTFRLLDPGMYGIEAKLELKDGPVLLFAVLHGDACISCYCKSQVAAEPLQSALRATGYFKTVEVTRPSPDMLALDIAYPHSGTGRLLESLQAACRIITEAPA